LLNVMKLKNLLAVICTVLVAVGMAAAVDGSSLKPPAGASVAIIVFEDMECPACAQAAPLLEQAAKTYNVPLVIHDFPLRMHAWANDASLIARYLDDKYGRSVSAEYRLYIYQYQAQVTKDNLRSYAERFAASKKLELPFMLDPKGEIAAKIKADVDLGTKIGLTETPTILVVSNKDWKHVADHSQLYSIIDQMKKDAGPAPAPTKAPTRSPAKRRPLRSMK
jgi:protein-disulfide isomerase